MAWNNKSRLLIIHFVKAEYILDYSCALRYITNKCQQKEVSESLSEVCRAGRNKNHSYLINIDWKFHWFWWLISVYYYQSIEQSINQTLMIEITAHVKILVEIEVTSVCTAAPVRHPALLAGCSLRGHDQDICCRSCKRHLGNGGAARVRPRPPAPALSEETDGSSFLQRGA